MQQLTPEKEDALEWWAIQLSEWGWPPQVHLLHEQAVHFLHLKGDDNPLSKNWMEPFLKQHPCLKIKYSNPLDKE